ncbi:hypothetical protein ACWEV3_40920 [Saccharopolyspora sp. NPDC003752]
MPGMGPPPNPNARRRNARPAMMQLPSEGRKGPVPEWPLPENLNLMVSLQMAQQTVDELSAREDLTPAEKRKLNKALEQVVFLDYKAQHVRDAELALWRELWATPQAVAWERLGYNREVAQYVRFKVDAEWGNLDAAKESRQYSDRLGLTPLAMLRLQWQIVEDETAEQRSVSASTARKRATPRDRLKVVADDVVEGTGTSG